MGIGGTELVLILLIAMIVIGPKRTMIYARKVGKWLRIFKTYMSSITDEFTDTVVEPLQELQEPLKEISRPFDQLTRDVNSAMKDISRPVEAAAADVRRSVSEIDGAIYRGTTAAKKPEPGQEPDASTAETLEMAEIIEDEAPAPEKTS